MKSIAFAKKSVAFDTKSRGNYRKPKKMIGSRREVNGILQNISSIRYEIKWKMQELDKKAKGKHYEINSIREEISSIRYEINKKLQKNDMKSIASDSKSKGKLQEINKNPTRCTEHRILTQFSASSPHALKRTSHRPQ